MTEYNKVKTDNIALTATIKTLQSDVKRLETQNYDANKELTEMRKKLYKFKKDNHHWYLDPYEMHEKQRYFETKYEECLNDKLNLDFELKEILFLLEQAQISKDDLKRWMETGRLEIGRLNTDSFKFSTKLTPNFIQKLNEKCNCSDHGCAQTKKQRHKKNLSVITKKEKKSILQNPLSPTSSECHSASNTHHQSESLRQKLSKEIDVSALSSESVSPDPISEFEKDLILATSNEKSTYSKMMKELEYDYMSSHLDSDSGKDWGRMKSNTEISYITAQRTDYEEKMPKHQDLSNIFL